MSEELSTTSGSDIAQTFNALNAIDGLVCRVINEIPDYTDDQLEQALIYSCTMEKAGFVIRGCVVNEIQLRTLKRTGGKDVDGLGVMAQISKLAHSMGKSVNLLQTDARIFRRFGEALMSEEEPLPREFYSTALSAGEKAEEAIQLAHKKKDDPTYSLRKYRDDIKLLCNGENAEDIEDIHWLNLGLTTEEHEAISHAAEQWGCNRAEAARECIRRTTKRMKNG